MQTLPLPHAIRLLTYLSPGLPLALFGAVADHLRRWPGLGGRPIALASEERVSGPGSGSVGRREDPFSRGEADVGFLCAPTYLGLRERGRPPAELLGVAPVFADERARGEPVYFCDMLVRRGSPAGSFSELEGGAWAFNDPFSLSGHGGLSVRLGSPEAAGRFFGRTIRSGSHPASVRLVAGGGADAASIDSNALRPRILLRATLAPGLTGASTPEPSPAPRADVRALTDAWGAAEESRERPCTTG